MLYFLGNELPEGTDTFVPQSIDLALILQKYQTAATVLTMNYDRLLKRTPVNGAAQQLVRNVWDELQQVGQLSKRVLTFRDLHLGRQQDWQINMATQEYHRDGQRLAVVHTIIDSPQLDYVDYYAPGDIVRKRDFYDRRGFKSVSQYLNTVGDVQQEIYWDVHGAAVLEQYFTPVPHHVARGGMVILPALAGREVVCTDMAHAMGVLLSDMITRDGHLAQSTVVAQDTPVVLHALAAMTTPRRLVFAHHSSLLHRTQTDSLWDHMQTLLHDFSGVIVPDAVIATRWAARTGEQLMVAQFPYHAEFPTGEIPPLVKRPHGTVLAYLGEDDQGAGLRVLMNLFTTLRQQVAGIRLTIYQPHLASTPVVTPANEQVGSVQFLTAPQQWQAALTTNQIFVTVDPYPAPAFMISALAYGLGIVAATDHPDAVNPFIRRGENGTVVAAGQNTLMTRAIQDLLHHKKSLNTAQKTSQTIAQQYTEDALVRQWQNLGGGDQNEDQES
ncbi:MAG: accessory Sec system glycosyltransferase Asp1 [Schleiferilactobacillus harbinensis]|jgi:hypothetical protein|uniref:Glycosyl transferase family 1 domain-containing protein n=1 Tax=Schleiferilactobacillus perolens DSM 12744 TaxID=1423792 RepID=A0A0R1NBY0_9LACO|nr:accessory Sec system glycosyltransferase Asp1 [Schleiferilactobacillus perolens]KRL13864.1 hypothetical protein FD09_GL001897 [Schleiferilactobacillus perolens DSM 12744]MCI1891877.1 accessory Sec system glycosyltransferase Asp1 [Schleiferilactobacillus harbinensis]MCI1911618.1 accessory Sec system glycosyltransferase Asp1 [Schleiferilactobacillus harbinensis]